MIQLRDYQQRMISEARQHIREGRRRILLQLPTGGGKTVIASAITQGAVAKGLSSWFLVHRDFLLEQTDATYKQIGLDPAIVSAKHPHRWQPLKPVQLCGIASVKGRRSNLVRPRLAVWDECHHIAAKTYADIFEWLGPGCIHIGLTATPERLDGRGLNDYFDVMVRGPKVTELMELGSLSRYRAFAPTRIDLSQVRRSHGDFNLGDLEDAVDKPHIVGDIVDCYSRFASGKRAVYFAVTIAHSQHIAAAFCEAGIPALHLDANSSSAERKDAARRFARGELQVLVNVDLFGEGYDLSAQAGMPVTIDAVGLCRPTQSLSLFLQQVGRALRPKADGSPAILLDHAGNIEQHGMPDDDREWSLAGRDKKAKPPGPIMCRHCLAMSPAFSVTCQVCGAELRQQGEERGPREIEHRDGELVELDPVAMRAKKLADKAALSLKRRNEEKACKSLADYERLARERGYNLGWAQHRWSSRQAAAMRWRGGSSHAFRR